MQLENQESKIDCTGTIFTMRLLRMMLEELNKRGSVHVVHVQPGSVDMLAIGAWLAEQAKEE